MDPATVPAIPEPQTWLVLALGLALLVGWTSEKRSKGMKRMPGENKGKRNAARCFEELHLAPTMPTLNTESLCVACGVCCNGVLFGDVVLQPGDKPARMRAWGIPLAARRGKLRFLQPCTAFGGDLCRIYEGRPRYCRDFECGLLRAVHAGQLKPAVALGWIRAIHRSAERVKRLLRQLGDDNEHVSLRRRFQSMARRCQSGAPHRKTAELFGRLTLAMHELNLRLRDRFYPGTARS